ncbi:MAG: GNAT family N-acetyltransferase [Caldilineaceae bacterium SB0661_bin_32]|uniref:GNAT family N-acetyltransferase n=1 Tax=Caldilineaceae bacterium SB0661_bin_32 TaxID=2605255 RepID=A0A6B1DC29_9CHLR|nr:GNAT family N-acetyltransferase [Caldilineaceae bacterium SB0661_bin_32]
MRPAIGRDAGKELKSMIVEVIEESQLWNQLWPVVEQLEQQPYIEVQAGHFRSSHLFAALVEGRPVGFLRFVVQRLGEDEGRPPIVFRDKVLYEAKIIAFGVLPEERNQGIGRSLQLEAMGRARELNCCQVRSRSDYGNDANFHLKTSLGFGIQPSLEDDSVYFVKALPLVDMVESS